MEGLKTQSRPRDLLDKAVVLFDDVVQIFHAQYLDQPVRLRELQTNIYPLKASQIGTTFINYNPFRGTVPLDRASKKQSGSTEMKLQQQRSLRAQTVTTASPTEL